MMTEYSGSIKEKSVAIASGKGGVGKTTTSANLALFYSKQGLPTLLIDMDPLSDLPSLLDLPAGTAESDGSLDEAIKPIFHNLDLLVPYFNDQDESHADAVDKLLQSHREILDSRYKVLLFDMPAGVDTETNIRFLNKVSRLVIVTNPEPTSHVSSGAYVKKVRDSHPDLPVLFWHNKFIPDGDGSFHPTDVLSNYNRNMPEEDRIEKAGIIKNLAFVPKDETMDLLRTDPSIRLNLQRNILNIVQSMLGLTLPPWPDSGIFHQRSRLLLQAYIRRHPDIKDVEEFTKELGLFLVPLLTGKLPDKNDPPVFSVEQEMELKSYLLKVKGFGLRELLIKTSILIEQKIKESESAASPFGFKGVGDSFRQMDRQLLALMMDLQNEAKNFPDLKNMTGLLLFYFALLKIFQSETVYSLVMDFIPKRKDSGGRDIRDRYSQISSLVKQDDQYRKRYFELIKTLHPVVSRQVEQIVKTFGFDIFLFLDKQGHINKEAYLKLFTNFVHETIYSGLGITIGFPYRPASVSFAKGARQLYGLAG